ncbi:MAG: FtsX-like permease family protein, partial [Phycisphaerales bacterium]
MSLWLLVVRSLRFYWRTHAAVLLAVAVATGVLTGALVVGDSVQYTLRRTVEARLGRAEFAVVPQNRYFRAALADDLDKEFAGAVVPVLQITGIVANDSDSRRINRVQVLGVDERFYAIGPGGDMSPPEVGAVVVSDAVAQRLGVTAGDEILLRVEKPGLMPRDVPMASDADRTIAFRLLVQAVADDTACGRFDLKANQTAPLNVFVPLTWLGAQIEQPGRANSLLATGAEGGGTFDELNSALEAVWNLADADLQLRQLEPQGMLELQSRRIFVDEVLGEEALKADEDAVGVLTYFVNEIRLGEKATPYSMVTAMAAGDDPDALIPPDMQSDEIVINQWLADDLGAQVGDSLDLTYYLVGPKRDLFERVSRFRVAKIIPLAGLAADPSLMPDFPGLADAENCRDWEPGIPVDLDKIRPEDEAYWDDYRGTPKAFITLPAGQGLWRNRYGNLTAVRYPWREGLDGQVTASLTGQTDPAAVGLFFQPVRQRGLQAGREGTDFGQLFLGLSMFLIAAAVILTGLLFVFGVESRCSQVGLLMAVGLSGRRVKRLLVMEGGLVALAGTVMGVGAGLLYTQLLVHGLSTLWRGAVAGTRIYFHAEPETLVFGALGGFVVALLAIWVTLRKHVTRSARELMEGHLESFHLRQGAWARGRLGLGAAVVSFLSVIVFLAVMGNGNSRSASGAFFGAGVLLLLGGIGLAQAILRIVGGGWSKPMVSLGGLGFRNTTRRGGRSLAIVGLLACGVFMVVAVGANRHDPMAAADSRQSGTGGFAFYGESSVAVLHDLNTEEGRSALGLDGVDLEGVEVVQFRVHEGDDASCLNLNRAQRPRLLAVDAKELARRKAFKFADTIDVSGDEEGWELLRADLDNGSVPAIGDYPTVYWALGKNIGDELEYTDEKGRVVRVRIVGMRESSIWQGSLVMAENEFMARFPSESG